MKKRLFTNVCLILLHFFTLSCSHQQQPINKTDENVFNIKSKYITTNDFIILTKRLLNQIVADDYFKNNQTKISLYFNTINNNLVNDNDATNLAIKDIVISILGSLDNVTIADNMPNDAFFVDMKYFLSEVSYLKWEKPAKALNANLYFYDNNRKEIKAWNDYLIKSEDFNLWQ